MKKLISNLFAIILAVMSVLIVSAQTSPPGGGGGGGGSTSALTDLPVTESMLDAYALALVQRVGVNMQAEHSGLEGFYTNLYIGNVANPEALAQLPNLFTPRITMANPSQDTVSYYVSYEGSVSGVSDKYQLFYGYATERPVLDNFGNWRLPVFKIRLIRSDYVPWPKKGLAGAGMVIRDEQGKVVDHYDFARDGRLNREQGIIFLGSKHMNRKGELYLEIRDEKGSPRIEVIDLGSGRPLPPQQVVSSGVNAVFDQVVILQPNAGLIWHRVVEDATKLYYVQYFTPVDVKIGYEAPPGVDVTIYAIGADDLRVNPDNWGKVTPGFSNPSPGRYFIRFEYGPPNVRPIPVPQPVYEGGNG